MNSHICSARHYKNYNAVTSKSSLRWVVNFKVEGTIRPYSVWLAVPSTLFSATKFQLVFVDSTDAHYFASFDFYNMKHVLLTKKNKMQNTAFPSLSLKMIKNIGIRKMPRQRKFVYRTIKVNKVVIFTMNQKCLGGRGGQS